MTKTSATREIPASAASIFALLSNPQRHAETDSAGGVRSCDFGERLKQIGDTFCMNMATPDGEEYQTLNEVFAFVADRVIGWQNKQNLTNGVLVGSKWLYELEPDGAYATKVTLTYDPTEIDDPMVQKLSKNFDASVLERSLATLADALA